MKSIFVATALLFTFLSADAQVFQVDNNGNVTAVGNVNGTGLNSTGTAGGQVSVVAGPAQQSVASGFSFQAPGTITNETQVVVPESALSGLWYGIKVTLPTATATVAGGVVTGLTVTSGGANLPTAPAVLLIGGGCNPCATAHVSSTTGTYPYLSVTTPNGITLDTAGSNYTSTPTVYFVSPAGTGNMMNLLFSPALLVEISNNTTTPPVQNEAVIISSGATVATTSSFAGIEGICTANCTTSGNAEVARSGLANCIFDGTATIGDYVQISTSSAGECTDGGSTYPSAHQVLGRIVSLVSGTTYQVLLYPMSGAYAISANPLSQFASTTSAQLASVISDETGTGSLVFGTSPTLVTPNLGTPKVAQLNDATHNTGVLGLSGVAGAVDYLTLTNSATGSPGTVQIGASGTDSGITLELLAKGTTGNVSLFLNGTEDYRFTSGSELFTGSGGTSWTSGTITSPVDSTLCRAGAGILEVNSGTGCGNGGTLQLSQLDIGTSVLVSATSPTISSGFGTSPSIPASNGTAAFRINVGSGGTANSGVVGLPTAPTGWNCYANDLSTTGPNVFATHQTASSTTSATLTNYNNSGTATAWHANDILAVSCFAL